MSDADLLRRMADKLDRSEFRRADALVLGKLVLELLKRTAH